MKNFCFIALLFIVSFSAKLYAKETNAIYGEIISCEIPDISGFVTIDIKCDVKRQVKLISNPVVTLPTGWNYQITADKAGQTFNNGESPVISLKINYNTVSLPFYPVTIRFTQDIMLDNDSNNIQKLFAEGKIYFTPYNTVEIWNNSDFFNIPRMWLDKASNIDTTRVFVSKSTIPVTNLTEEDTIVYEWQEDWTYKKIPGLAYYIPMKAMHPDSVEWYAQNIGDGSDILPEPKSTYSGRVRGRLYTCIQNDIGQWVKIYLTGIRVKLLEEDLAWNEVFAEGYTDDNGYFDLQYNKWQTFEGGKIELHLQIKSKTKDESDYKIKCKQNNMWQNIYEEKIYLGQFTKDYQDIQKGDVIRNHDAFRVVHWARNGMRFLGTAYSGFMGKLEIHIFRNQSHFFADGFYGISAPLDDPSIYLEDEDGDHENVIYHEFGHYIMWELQNRNWITMWCKTGDCSHSWGEENTSRLAWCEGWADAMQMILDAYWRGEDGEYGHDELFGYNYQYWGPLYERRINFYINNGLWSEYYIACAIYDLWDGPNKGLSGYISGTSLHAYNDSYAGGWNDDVELTFSQIIQPILSHSGITGKIHHIGEYYSYLLNEVAGDNCVLRNKISRCFAENRVLYDIEKFNNKSGYTCLTSDDVYTDRTENIHGEFFGLLHTTYSDTYNVNLYSTENAVKNIYFYSFIKKYITDNLWLGDNINSVILKINPEMINSDFPFYQTTSGTMYTCNNSDIKLNNGSLILGGTNTTANLEISSNSLLQIGANCNLTINNNSKVIIKNGGSLHIKTGAIIDVSGNGFIQIESGGYLCIEPGVNFNNKDINNSLLLQSGFILGINPIKGITANCMNYSCGIFIDVTVASLQINDLYEIQNSLNTVITNNIYVNAGGVLKITDSQIQLYDNVSISVYNGGKLEVSGSILKNIDNCNNTWSGIYAQPGSIVEIRNNSVIEKCSNGVSADNAYITINNSVIRDVGNGIYSEEATVIVTNSEIKNTDAGIYAKLGSNVTVNNCQVYNTGYAFEAYSGTKLNIYNTTIKNFYPNAISLYLLSKGNFNNITIENTYNADITGIDANDNSIVNIVNSTIKNCKNSVKISSFRDWTDLPYGPVYIASENNSIINNNTFLFAAQDYSVFTFVELTNVKGIKLKGNTFKNTNTGYIEGGDRTGIKSTNSQFSLSNLNPLNPLYSKRNKFENLTYGLKAENYTATSINISETDFINNYRGIFLNGVNNAKISKCSFIIQVGVGGDNSSYGVYLNSCKNFEISENVFNSYSGQKANFGIYVNTSSPFNYSAYSL